MSNRQEVNLYLPRLRPSTDYLSAPMVARGLAGLLVLFVVITLVMVLQTHQRRDQLAEKQQLVVTQEQQLKEMLAKLPKSQAHRLEAQVQQLQVEIKKLQAVSHIIDGQSFASDVGFTDQLEALAENASAELSVNRFELDQVSRRISLSGKARVAQAVPLYVEELRASESFQRSVFGQLKIEQQDNSAGLHFSLNGVEADTDG